MSALLLDPFVVVIFGGVVGFTCAWIARSAEANSDISRWSRQNAALRESRDEALAHLGRVTTMRDKVAVNFREEQTRRIRHQLHADNLRAAMRGVLDTLPDDLPSPPF